MIVIHWTDGLFQTALDWLKNPDSQVSANELIDHTGQRIVELVKPYNRAWHCGGSWHPLLASDINAETVGIECEGPPSSIGQPGWSDDFIASLFALCTYLKGEVPSLVGFVDHSTINPKQKIDVKRGKGIDAFPWDQFANMMADVDLVDFTVEPYASEIRRHFGLV